MHVIFRLLFVLILIVSACPTAIAQSATTAKDLRGYCEFYLSRPSSAGLVEATKAGYCAGFAKAIMNLGRELKAPVRFCPPPNTTVDQTIKTIVAYIDKNEDLAEENATAAAVVGLGIAWDCK